MSCKQNVINKFFVVYLAFTTHLHRLTGKLKQINLKKPLKKHSIICMYNN